MKRILPLILILIFFVDSCYSEKVITVEKSHGDATSLLQKAINEASHYKDEPVIIRLSGGDYNLCREKASKKLYHISNTSSIKENPDQTKHIGLWFQNLKNVTFDGNGSRLITHGEMTTFVIDSCSNISLTNFSLTAADPSVPEIKILDKDDSSMTFEVIKPSDFVIDDGLFFFKGDGWIFGHAGSISNLPLYAQVYYPEKNITLRCEPPIKDYISAEQISDRIVRMEFAKVPNVLPGQIYQMRHGIRNEVCGFINMSNNIHIKDVNFNFLGNFGLVGQFTENITLDNVHCEPDKDSGRTDAGFADFVQMSGCKGKIIIKNSRFEGAQDDPINIHGTHLKVIASDSPYKILVKYMHAQSYGFTPFFVGDEVEIINRHTLNSVMNALVKNVRKIDNYIYELTLDKQIPSLTDDYSLEDFAIENITWTPEVEITNNYFARIPTRGILITTRRKSLIEGNTFFRIPMASILVSDDANSWYESGLVNDLTIRNNTFIECSSPVISIRPEIKLFDQPVHKNIVIEENKFIGSDANYLELNATDNVIICNNIFTPID